MVPGGSRVWFPPWFQDGSPLCNRGTIRNRSPEPSGTGPGTVRQLEALPKVRPAAGAWPRIPQTCARFVTGKADAA